MLVAEDLINKCSVTLKDPEFVRWTKDELLSYLDEAQREIARTPGANVKTVMHSLVEGTKQAMPDDAYAMLTITRNWSECDNPTLPVRITTRALLDSFNPFWHMDPCTAVVENYVYDDRTPREFFVYPPNDGYGTVELMYCAIPEKLTSITDSLELREEFEVPLMMYTLYRAYTKDSDYSAGLQLASSFYTSYMSSLQAVMQQKGMATPNASLVQGAVKPNGGTE